VQACRARRIYADADPSRLHRQVLGDRVESALVDHRHRPTHRGHSCGSGARQGRGNRDDGSAGFLRQIDDHPLGEIKKSFEVRRDQRLEVLGGVSVKG